LAICSNELQAPNVQPAQGDDGLSRLNGEDHGVLFRTAAASAGDDDSASAGACLAAASGPRALRMHARAPPDHPFSSFFSSLKKRQSVPWAMIFCGVDLIIPAS
jgi:hypothetical protein